MSRNIDKYFRSGGKIANELPGYMPRRQQTLAAEAISEALQDAGVVALVEAGTGVGKTLAYLFPTLLCASPDNKIVISTHTLALQAQLWTRDIPLALRLPGIQLKTALMKGRGNYLCLQEMNAARNVLQIAAEPRFDEILDWSEETEAGDLAELPFNYPDWSEISAHPDTCRGTECRYFDECFYFKAKRTAEDASIILVNHALYFSDLAMRRDEDATPLLPDYAFVVFDEAHHLENAAAQAFGVTVTSASVGSLIKRLRRAGSALESDEHRVRQLERETSELFALFTIEARQDFIVSELIPDLTWPREQVDLIAGVLRDIVTDLKRVNASNDLKLKERVDGLVRQTSRVREELLTIFHLDDPNYIRWGSSTTYRDGTAAVSLHYTPIDVGSTLSGALWEPRIVSAALVSATLATNGDFTFLKQRLGLISPSNSEQNDGPGEHQPPPTKTVEAIVDSPFDYQNNCLLYIPRHLPIPNGSPEYTSLIASEITELIDSSQGGAFLLFTSHRMLQQMYSILVELNLPYPFFRQGEMPGGRLVDEFRKCRDGVLFGTQSFWEGVDVPGEALRLVIVDRLPFTSPDNPLHKARVDSIKRAGGDWFRDYALPQAQLKLKQGFGRLIRSSTDRGVVAVLDSRLVKKHYGQEFLRYLPDARKTFYLDEVQSFFHEFAAKNAD